VNHLVKSFLQDANAATAIEYALIVMGIGILIISGVQSLGISVKKPFEIINAALEVKQ